MSPAGSIWVVAEERDGVLERVMLELVGEARRIAGRDEVGALLLGEGVEPLANELARYGADTVHLVNDPGLRIVATSGRIDISGDLGRWQRTFLRRPSMARKNYRMPPSAP